MNSKREVTLDETIKRFAGLVGEDTVISATAEAHEFLDQACDIIVAYREALTETQRVVGILHHALNHVANYAKSIATKETEDVDHKLDTIDLDLKRVLDQ